MEQTVYEWPWRAEQTTQTRPKIDEFLLFLQTQLHVEPGEHLMNGDKVKRMVQEVATRSLYAGEHSDIFLRYCGLQGLPLAVQVGPGWDAIRHAAKGLEKTASEDTTSDKRRAMGPLWAAFARRKKRWCAFWAVAGTIGIEKCTHYGLVPLNDEEPQQEKETKDVHPSPGLRYLEALRAAVLSCGTWEVFRARANHLIFKCHCRQAKGHGRRTIAARVRMAKWSLTYRDLEDMRRLEDMPGCPSRVEASGKDLEMDKYGLLVPLSLVFIDVIDGALVSTKAVPSRPQREGRGNSGQEATRNNQGSDTTSKRKRPALANGVSVSQSTTTPTNQSAQLKRARIAQDEQSHRDTRSSSRLGKSRYDVDHDTIPNQYLSKAAPKSQQPDAGVGDCNGAPATTGARVSADDGRSGTGDSPRQQPSSIRLVQRPQEKNNPKAQDTANMDRGDEVSAGSSAQSSSRESRSNRALALPIPARSEPMQSCYGTATASSAAVHSSVRTNRPASQLTLQAVQKANNAATETDRAAGPSDGMKQRLSANPSPFPDIVDGLQYILTKWADGERSSKRFGRAKTWLLRSQVAGVYHLKDAGAKSSRLDVVQASDAELMAALDNGQQLAKACLVTHDSTAAGEDAEAVMTKRTFDYLQRAYSNLVEPDGHRYSSVEIPPALQLTTPREIRERFEAEQREERYRGMRMETPPLSFTGLKGVIHTPSPPFVHHGSLSMLRVVNAYPSRPLRAGGNETRRTLAQYEEFDTITTSLAFEESYTDVLGGLVAHCVVGAMLWLCATDLSAKDWQEFEEKGRQYVPPAGKIFAIRLSMGESLYFPAGTRFVHAHITLRPSLIQCRRVWDARELPTVLSHIAQVRRLPHITNAPPPRHIKHLIETADHCLGFWRQPAQDAGTLHRHEKDDEAMATLCSRWKAACKLVLALSCACRSECAAHGREGDGLLGSLVSQSTACHCRLVGCTDLCSGHLAPSSSTPDLVCHNGLAGSCPACGYAPIMPADGEAPAQGRRWKVMANKRKADSEPPPDSKQVDSS